MGANTHMTTCLICNSLRIAQFVIRICRSWWRLMTTLHHLTCCVMVVICLALCSCGDPMTRFYKFAICKHVVFSFMSNSSTLFYSLCCHELFKLCIWRFSTACTTHFTGAVSHKRAACGSFRQMVDSNHQLL